MKNDIIEEYLIKKLIDIEESKLDNYQEIFPDKKNYEEIEDFISFIKNDLKLMKYYLAIYEEIFYLLGPRETAERKGWLKNLEEKDED